MTQEKFQFTTQSNYPTLSVIQTHDNTQLYMQVIDYGALVLIVLIIGIVALMITRRVYVYKIKMAELSTMDYEKYLASYDKNPEVKMKTEPEVKE